MESGKTREEAIDARALSSLQAVLAAEKTKVKPDSDAKPTRIPDRIAEWIVPRNAAPIPRAIRTPETESSLARSDIL